MTDAQWPQPHEGIIGTLRDEDDLLSLDEKAIPRRMQMIGMADCLHSACLVGNQAPVVRRMYERMKDPQPGDLVVEFTARSSRRGAAHRARGFGILICHRREWWETNEEWAKDVEQQRRDHAEFLAGPYAAPGDELEPFTPEERRADHAWYIQYGQDPATICRWVNCEFIAILDDSHAFEVPAGTSDGSRVTLTRDDLIGGLADSGFSLRTPWA